MKEKYLPEHLNIIVPTRNRPEQVRQLLKSIVSQNFDLGKVIIVASGDDISTTIAEYSAQLNVEYIFTTTFGQVNQRNIAISKLDDQCRIALSLDDDIVLEDSCLEKLLECWNNADESVAGIGLNLFKQPKNYPFWLANTLRVGHKQPGVVCESGYNTSYFNEDKLVQTQWLCGGATSWRSTILQTEHHKAPFNVTWSPCEDVIYSYAVSKKFKLFCCPTAKAVIIDNPAAPKAGRAYTNGKLIAYWHFYFVSLHPELSKKWATLFLLMRSLKYFFHALKSLSASSIFKSIGVAVATCLVTSKFITKKEVDYARLIC